MTNYGTFIVVSKEQEHRHAATGLLLCQNIHRLPKDICQVIGEYAIDYDAIQQLLKEENELWKSAAPKRMPRRVLTAIIFVLAIYLGCVVYLSIVGPTYLILLLFGLIEMNCIILCSAVDLFYWICSWYDFHRQRIEIRNRASSLPTCRYKVPSFCNLLCKSGIGNHSETDRMVDCIV